MSPKLMPDMTVLRPLGKGDLTGLHDPARVWREAARLQPDDVGDVHAGQGPAPPQQVPGTQELEIVRRRMAGEAEVLLALPQDLVQELVPSDAELGSKILRPAELRAKL